MKCMRATFYTLNLRKKSGSVIFYMQSEDFIHTKHNDFILTLKSRIGNTAHYINYRVHSITYLLLKCNLSQKRDTYSYNAIRVWTQT